MARVRVHNLAISLDGCVAGPDQSIENPLGVGGERLHDWVFATRAARILHGLEGGEEGIDNDWVARGDVGDPTADSVQSKGSTFRLTLPRANGKATQT